MSKIVTYDLCGENKDYKDLIAAIKSYSKWAKVTESSWVIVTDSTCVQIRENLKKFMDSDDRIFVASLTGEAAWTRVICDSDSLKDRL